MTPLDCTNLSFMALTVWREARGQSPECIAGVAHSILNRVNRPSWWGNSIMRVIKRKWQYSSMTDPNDKQLTLWPDEDEESWNKCLTITNMVIKGMIPNPVPGADSYFDISIKTPYWATDEIFVKQIGRVKFYNVDKDIEAEVIQG